MPTSNAGLDLVRKRTSVGRVVQGRMCCSFGFWSQPECCLGTGHVTSLYLMWSLNILISRNKWESISLSRSQCEKGKGVAQEDAPSWAAGFSFERRVGFHKNSGLQDEEEIWMSVQPLVKGEDIPGSWGRKGGHGTRSWHTTIPSFNSPFLPMPNFLMTSQDTHDYSLAHHSY